MTEDMREDFERHIISFYGESTECLERNGLGMYCDPYVSARWAGWQAATEQAEQRIKELEARIAKSNEVNMGLVDQRDKLQAVIDGMELIGYAVPDAAEIMTERGCTLIVPTASDLHTVPVYTKPEILP